MPVNTTFHGTVLVVRKQANPATVQQGTPPRNRSVTAFLAASGASPWGGEPPLAGGGGVGGWRPILSERRVPCTGPQGARSHPALGEIWGR